jgi:predicted Fe-S protein YdhL (DUF1289 family)
MTHPPDLVVPVLGPTVSPCTGICRIDGASQLCHGCARSADEIAVWRGAEPAFRAAIWADLPVRFARLGIAARRQPWDEARLRDEISARIAGGWTVVLGVVGAVAEFRPAPGEDATLTWDGPALVARTSGGSLRLILDDRVRALAFPQYDGQPILALAVLRERGGPPRAHGLTPLGPDHDAIEATDRTAPLFDLGLGRKEARFCLRMAPGPLADQMSTAAGAELPALLSSKGASLLAASPVRVVETALGRAEVATPIPLPGGRSPDGPHTHLLPDHLATGLATPVSLPVPRAYFPGALLYPPG